MATFIALLRGINVGGKNRVEMSRLKKSFEDHGFTEVVTYLNSGNVVFDSENENLAELRKACEQLIEKEFQLSIITTIVAGADLLTALEKVPAWWDADKSAKHNAIFVIPPVTTEEVGSVYAAYEKLEYHGRIIFWSAPLETYSRTRLSKVVGKPLYKSITIRNANTVKKLEQLVQMRS